MSDSQRTPDRLADALLYLCTDRHGTPAELERFTDEVLAAGVDIIQLRDKTLEAAEELDLLAMMSEACARHGRLLAVNDRADVALTAAADVLHVGQGDLPPVAARRILGAGPVIGRSSHSVAQAAAAATESEVGYFCVGPVWATPTKPGRPGIGLDPVRTVAQQAPERPWFAIGGVDETTLPQVLDAGASRVVVVRAITEAADPGAATARIRAALAGRATAARQA